MDWKSNLEADSAFAQSTLSSLKQQTTKTKSSIGYRLTPRKSEITKRHKELPIHLHCNEANSNTEKDHEGLAAIDAKNPRKRSAQGLAEEKGQRN